MSQELSFTSVLETAAKLPLVHIDRKKFLTDNLSKVCTTEQFNKALDCGTLQAGIAVNLLDSIANAVINAETLKVTTISAAAGLPGGLAMLATIPADLAQFYGFILRTAQELAYLYGWDELVTEDNSLALDAATESQLILFVGVMSGVAAAGGAVTKLFGEAAMRAVAKKVAAKALTKTWYYPIAKKVASLLGVKLVKSTFAKGVSKAVPVVGGVISGGLTLATFKPMAHRLQKHLSKLAHMSPEEYAAYEENIAVEDIAIDVNCTPVEADDSVTNFWVCACGAENKGKFCTECGKARPVSRPQYRCNSCGWAPEDNTQPPKFCPECGDPFDEEDIVLNS